MIPIKQKYITMKNKLRKVPIKYLLTILMLLAVIGLGTLQLHNILNYPLNRGFDADAHIAYITFIQSQQRIPTTVEGWETYQQPLYYLIGSLLPSISAVRYLHLVYYLLLLATAFIFFKKVFKDYFLSLLGVLHLGSLPVIIYLTPPISNEFFSAVLISLTLMYYVLNNKLETVGQRIIQGILLGLAIASKATALVLVITIVMDQLLPTFPSFNKARIKRSGMNLFMVLTIAMIIGGANYLRHFIMFGNPVLAPYDLHTYQQEYVARNWRFFTDISGFLTMDLFRAHHYSFIPGTYFSWFYDGHNVIIPVQEFSKAGAVLILLSIPFLAIFIKSLYTSPKHKDVISRPLGLYIGLLFVSYIMYNFRLPFYSTVKGAFLSSLAVPFVYFYLRELKRYQLPTLSLVSLYSVGYIMLVIKHFWILDWWY